MKVLLINEECGTGSTGRICTDLATALHHYGNEAMVAFGRNASIMPKQYRKYSFQIGSDFEIKIHGLITRAFDASGFGSIRGTRKFVQWVKNYNPDIIHLHNLHGYYINIRLLFDLLKELNKPVIWTLHDVWPFTGHSAYCDAVNCNKWIKGCGHCPQLHVYPKAYIDRSKTNWKKKKTVFCGVKGMSLVVPSEWLANLVKNSFLNDYPVTIINNGIDVSRFHKIKTSKRVGLKLEDKIVVLSVATVWNNMKGFSDFIKLAKLLDDRFRIVLVGGMTDKQEKELPLNIIHIGKTQNIDEMVELYSMSDAFVNLTYCDTYPTVNLEAVACGIPIVTYAVGGSLEIAKQYGGIAVNRGDVKSVAQVLHNIETVRAIVPDRRKIDKAETIRGYLNLYGIEEDTI